ncbi:MAG TPA: DUF748 domain-containing protein [Marinobacterium sp.]|nr:DUF748 domain-containing protein [Marinobacterium sp.]
MRPVYWAVSLLLLGLLTFHVTPYVARDLIVYTLLQQGANEVRLKQVSIDWLDASVSLSGLELRHADRSVLQLRRLNVGIYLKELLDKRLRLSGLRLEDADLQLQQQDQMILLGPIVLAGQTREPEEVESASRLQIGSDLVELVDVNIQLLQSQGAQQLNIERLNIGAFYQWSPLESTDIRFVGHLNDAPITIDSSALPLPERKTVSVNVALRQLELTPLLSTIEPDMAASLDANLNIEVALEGYNAWVSQSGSLRLNAVDIRSDDLELEVSQLLWQGRARQHLDLSEGAELLTELSLNGTFNAEGLSLKQGAQIGRIGSIEIEPNVRFNPAQSSLNGSLNLLLGDTELQSELGYLQLGTLQLNAPQIQSDSDLDIDIQIEQLVTVDAGGKRASIGQLRGGLGLGTQASEPVWNPVSVDADMVLDNLRVASPQLEASVQKLQLRGSSSSLDRLDRLQVSGGVQALALSSADLDGRLANIDLMLSYRVDTEEMALQLDLVEPVLTLGDLGLSGQQVSAQYAGRLSADLKEADAAIGLSGTHLQLHRGEEQYRLEEVDLDGPLRLSLPQSALPLSLDSLKSTKMDLSVRGLEAEGETLSGVLAQLDLRTQFDQLTEAIDLHLEVKQADFKAKDVAVKTDTSLLNLKGKFGSSSAVLDAAVELQSSAFSLSQNERQIAGESLAFDGQMQLPISAELASRPLALSGNVNLQQLNLSTEQQRRVALDVMSGDVQVEQQGSASLITSLMLQQLEYSDPVQKLEIRSVQLQPELNFNHLLSQLDPQSVTGSITAVLEQLSLQSDEADMTLLGLDTKLNLSRQAEEQSIQLSGDAESTGTPVGADVANRSLALSGNVNLQQLNWSTQQQRRVALAALSGDIFVRQQEGTSLSASLGLQQLEYSDPAQRLEIRSSELRPELNFIDPLSQLDPQSVSGSVSAVIEQLALQTNDAGISVAALNTDLNFTRQGENQRVRGSVDAEAINLRQGMLSASVQELRLQPQLQRSAEVLQLATPVKADGLNYADKEQQVQAASLQSDLSLLLDSGFVLQSASLGASQLDQLRVLGPQSVALQQAKLQGFSLTKDQQFDLQNLEFTELLVGSSETPLLALNRFEVDRAAFADNYLELGTLLTIDLLANVQTELKAGVGDSNANSAETPAETADIREATETSAKEMHLPFDISLMGWLAQGGTELNYRDTSLAAPLILKLVASQVSAGEWDSRSGKVLPLKLRAKLNEAADISLDANITPLRTKPSGDWTLSISSLPMPILSPLVQSFAGYQIRSGALNLVSTGTLKDGQINGNNAVRIQRLEVQRAQDSAANETDKLFTMPLPSAVSILESDERVIKLDLPVSGDINDPKFNYQDVIQIVVTKGVKEGAMAYLTNSLQPFGAIFMVYSAVKDANESGRFIQLQAMEFDSAEVGLNQMGRDYAAKLAGMMQERPTLTLEICPVTTVDEERLLWDQLVEEQLKAEAPVPEMELGNLWSQRIADLAAGRIESLRSALIRVGIANERIFPCIARAGATEGMPRLELAF